MKIGIRKPSLKRSISARTTGKLKRTVKKSINPLYGKKGMGYINNPKKAVYNKIYNKTTVGINPLSDITSSQNTKISHDIDFNTKDKLTLEDSPKTQKNLSIVLMALSNLLFMLSLVLCFATLPAGLLGCLFAVITFSIGKKYANVSKESPKVSNKQSLHKYFEFPQEDKRGRDILKNTHYMIVVGVRFIKNGVNPQDIIPNLAIGERIILEADPNNEYDCYAVKVKTNTGMQIGWLPKGDELQINISERLQQGHTVLARVKCIYELSDFPGYKGLKIEIARYSKR